MNKEKNDKFVNSNKKIIKKINKEINENESLKEKKNQLKNNNVGVDNSKQRKIEKINKEIINKDENLESCKIIVTNLSFHINIDDFCKIFVSCGNIKDARLNFGKNGNFRGFGFVEFYDLESARKAIAFSGNLICGRPLHVVFSFEKKKINIEK